jgi:insertion element IS1 protein InsB
LKNEEQFLVIDSAMNNQENAPTNKLICPRCQLSHIKKNGHTYYGKQNHRCLDCGRQFVIRQKTVATETEQIICRLLLERISLRGICRVFGIQLCWLMNFIARLYQQMPLDLNFVMPAEADFQMLCLEADEMWSFVGKKENKRWIWLIIERTTYQVVAVHIGDRSETSAKALWRKVPLEVRKQACVLTDNWDAYAAAIPANQHTACDKHSGQTSMIEGFNCALRQRISRLVRKTLSFSKNDTNHQGAIKYFLSHRNLERQKLCFSP